MIVSTILNNIAEANGKRSRPDRCRYFDVSRGAALECASCLDVLVARKRQRPKWPKVSRGMYSKKT